MFHLVNSGFFYIVLCECTRKQFPKRVLEIFSILFGNKNSKRIRLAEFCHDLSAHTARIQIIVSISIDRNCCKLTLSLIDCLKKCCTLRTVCRCISRIFNIASRIYPSILSKQRSSHFKVRIRGIRIYKLRKRDFYHFLNLFFFHSLFSCFFLLNNFIQNRMPDRSFRHLYS